MGKGTDFPRAKDMKAYECPEKTILTDYGQFMKRYNTEAEKIIQKLQIFSQEKYEDRLFVPVFGAESFKKNLFLNGLEQNTILRRWILCFGFVKWQQTPRCMDERP